MYQQPQQQGYPQQSGFMVPGAGYPQQGGGPSVNVTMGQDGAGYGDNWNTDTSALFAEKAIRQAFISKVYSILSVQLVFTSLMIGVFVLNSDTKLYFARQPAWMYLGFGIFFVAYLVMLCVESARRSTPFNYIGLSALTFGYGLVAAIVSCRYDTRVVLFAFAATAISCFLIALFAKSTKFDMTNCGTTLCILGLAHLVICMILVAILVPAGKASLASLILSVSGALLVSMYLIYDLQLIMGGRKCELSPEEYILAAIMLYVDIVQLFIYMLEIINRVSSD